MKGKPGRPSLKTPELCDEILERIATGEPLAAICRDEHMPSWRAVYDWLTADAELSAGFARARVHGFDVIAAEALRIADTPVEGEERTIKADGQVETRTSDMLGHRKLQIETRLKLLAKWDPKRYGERQSIDLTTKPAEDMTEDELIRIASGGRAAAASEDSPVAD